MRFPEFGVNCTPNYPRNRRSKNDQGLRENEPLFDMRSYLEQDVANALTEHKVLWKYESFYMRDSSDVHLTRQKRWTPDFELPNHVLLEVKPHRGKPFHWSASLAFQVAFITAVAAHYYDVFLGNTKNGFFKVVPQEQATLDRDYLENALRPSSFAQVIAAAVR